MQKNFLSHLKSYTDTEIGGIKDRKGCVIMSERNILENQTMNETKVNHKYYLGEPMVIVDPEGTNHKVIIDEEGYFVDFPGIEQGRWTIYLERPVKFDGSERNEFGVVLLRHEDGFRCFWTIQTDGRYWADDDGFGAEDDFEIILYADMDNKGNFTGPFRIHKIDGKSEEKFFE